MQNVEWINMYSFYTYLLAATLYPVMLRCPGVGGQQRTRETQDPRAVETYTQVNHVRYYMCATEYNVGHEVGT